MPTPTPSPKSVCRAAAKCRTQSLGFSPRRTRQFHSLLDLGNQLLAWSQCHERGIPARPDQHVSRAGKPWDAGCAKGEKAITLCMPITVKRKAPGDSPHTADTAQTAQDEPEVFTRFMYKSSMVRTRAKQKARSWPSSPMPAWDRDHALDALDVQEIPFDHTGRQLSRVYARDRSIAINPVNPLPNKTQVP